MWRKETFLEKLEKLGRELLNESRLKGEEFVKARLQWEDWEELLPGLTKFAEGEIRRRKWRGKRGGVLPEGYDANSIAAEVIARALQGKGRLVRGWTLERLEKELQRLVSHQVRRLHKLKERLVMRSEWEMLSPNPEDGQVRSALDQVRAKGSSGMHPAVEVQGKEMRAAEQRIVERLRGEDELVEKLFVCWCQGVVKRREIAAKLGVSVEEVTNCRKRLKRKLDGLAKMEAGVPRWVVEELGK